VTRHCALEADHLVHHRDILRRHVLHRLDACDEIANALRAEHDAERRLIVARRVDDAEPLHERALRRNEIRARRSQADFVDREVVPDPVQLVRRRLVLRTRALEARVETVDLPEDRLRLRALGVDSGVANSNAGYDRGRNESDDENKRLPRNVASQQAHREGPVRHKFSRLAGVPDACNRLIGAKLLHFATEPARSSLARDVTKLWGLRLQPATVPPSCAGFVPLRRCSRWGSSRERQRQDRR
jgi:hypothetical protein